MCDICNQEPCTCPDQVQNQHDQAPQEDVSAQQSCPHQKQLINARWNPTTVKCGTVATMLADTQNIAADVAATYTVKKIDNTAITTVNVQKGSVVSEGDVLCFLESMKMENPILAPLGGTVTKIELSPGQVVEAGDLVAIIEY